MNMQNAEACLPLCAHIYLYFDAAKFSINFHLYILQFLFGQWNEYGIVTEATH